MSIHLISRNLDLAPSQATIPPPAYSALSAEHEANVRREISRLTKEHDEARQGEVMR